MDTSHELTDSVGRLLIVGFEGTEFPELEALVTSVRPAGIIFFKRNYPAEGPRYLRDLILSVQALAEAELGRELFIAIDHEGGRVQRLPRPYTPLPPAGRAPTDPEYLQMVERGARELAATGFNFNLAPVLDVSAPLSGILGDRAFSDDPAAVANLGRDCLEVFHRAGILGAGKHFPGLGAAVVDPHHELPTIRSEAGRLMDIDIRPFLELAVPPADLLAVMTTHALYPALDSEFPATFSEDIVGLLKNELEFPGAVLTDDLEMGAVVKNFPLGEAAVRAIQAGHDLALVCRKREYIDECRRALAAALRSGALTEARLSEAHARSDLLRDRLQSLRPALADLESWFREIVG